MAEHEIEAGDIVGDETFAFLVVDHEECGCISTRAVCILGDSQDYPNGGMIAERDGDLAELFTNAKYVRLGRVETYVLELQDRLRAHRAANPPKPKRKTRGKT
jgi:hypothetical protein